MNKYPSASEVMVCWNPGTDQVKIVNHPDYENKSKGYRMTALGCYTWLKKATFTEKKMMCFIQAIHLIIRDKCDPMAVHNALLGIEEYRDGLSDDFPGIEGEDKITRNLNK